MTVPQSITVSRTTYLVKLCHILKSTEITLQELAHHWTEHPETVICEAFKAVTMMMSINFWNIMPTFQMSMPPPSSFWHTKACTSGGHAFGMLVMNCNLSSEPTERNNFTVVSVIINSQAKEFTCTHFTCRFITTTYTEINTFFTVGSKFHYVHFDRI